jgi:Kef-type K+ transport system membrane component KefB
VSSLSRNLRRVFVLSVFAAVVGGFVYVGQTHPEAFGLLIPALAVGFILTAYLIGRRERMRGAQRVAGGVLARDGVRATALVLQVAPSAGGATEVPVRLAVQIEVPEKGEKWKTFIDTMVPSEHVGSLYSYTQVGVLYDPKSKYVAMLDPERLPWGREPGSS